MSWLDDALDFELFNLKDMWKKVKDDPERLLIGAGTPWDTKLWNGVLGKDYEPLVDQMGGAYGGHTISAFGNTDGGVYRRASDAGINTIPGAAMQDLAHVIAAYYAGGYGMDQLGMGQSMGGNNIPRMNLNMNQRSQSEVDQDLLMQILLAQETQQQPWSTYG